jgi:hypothetical protein
MPTRGIYSDVTLPYLILKLIRENTTANALLITNGVLSLATKRALITHSPYILPKHMFLVLSRDVICSTARLRLRVHTLRFETATWN